MGKETHRPQIVMYQMVGNDRQIRVRIEGENVWLTQKLIAELFGVDIRTANEHLANIFAENELVEEATIRNFRIVQKEATRDVERDVKHYNLDAILAVGYRVRSERGIQFRTWATERLREYLVKGFTMDDERLKGGSGGAYWKELLERIRDIRSSEKVLYRQVLDLYATSVDYDPKGPESAMFFKTVQNKLHYATNEQTAAEVIHSRADADKDYMGLTTFKGAVPVLADVGIAKNYLTEDELFRLNRLVSAFFDLAEIQAQDHTPMCMNDWIVQLDKFSLNFGRGVLNSAGSISHDQAITKAEREYRKYQEKTISPVEEAYLETVKGLQKKVEKKT